MASRRRCPGIGLDPSVSGIWQATWETMIIPPGAPVRNSPNRAMAGLARSRPYSKGHGEQKDGATRGRASGAASVSRPSGVSPDLLLGSERGDSPCSWRNATSRSSSGSSHAAAPRFSQPRLLQRSRVAEELLVSRGAAALLADKLRLAYDLGELLELGRVVGLLPLA